MVSSRYCPFLSMLWISVRVKKGQFNCYLSVLAKVGLRFEEGSLKDVLT